MPLGYLLDTNIVSYLLNDRDHILIERIAEIEEEALFISSITCYEIRLGLERRLLQLPNNRRLLIMRNRFGKWFKETNIVPFDSQAASVAARLNARLTSKGRTLQKPDLFMAAQAIANDLVLISHDQKAFYGLHSEGLLWEDWCVP